jgi:hypothetical protein
MIVKNGLGEAAEATSEEMSEAVALLGWRATRAESAGVPIPQVMGKMTIRTLELSAVVCKSMVESDLRAIAKRRASLALHTSLLDSLESELAERRIQEQHPTGLPR